MSRERNYAEDVARWIDTCPGVFTADTSGNAIQAAYAKYVKTMPRFPGNEDRQIARFAETLSICGYQPRFRQAHGDTKNDQGQVVFKAGTAYWDLPLPAIPIE